MEMITDATGLLSCYYSAAVAETADLASLAAVAEMAVADLSSGSYLFFAVAVAVETVSSRSLYAQPCYPFLYWVTIQRHPGTFRSAFIIYSLFQCE